ncbi:baseplate J/gp47 family protein [Lachnospiraceae bacterium 54-53]
MQFDSESCMLRMREDLQKPGNKLEGGFCMDNIRAVSEEIGRLAQMELTQVKEAVATSLEELITSGNENHYVYWAKKIEGVGNARAHGARDGSGVVNVAVISGNASEASPALIQAVADYIETQRPVGASPVVFTASGIDVTLSAIVTLRPNYTITEIRENAIQKLTDWLVNISFSKNEPSLSYSKVGSILFSVPGVEDIPAYTINGGRESIPGNFDNYFSLKEVVISGSS